MENTDGIHCACVQTVQQNITIVLQTLQTGVDGPKVREIPRRDLEKELAGLKVTTERVAILLPRTVQKMKYLDMDILPENTRKIIGETMDNGFISIMYVDEVKGIEFDKVFVVSAKMRRKEERNLPEVQDEEKEAEQINSELIIHISCIYKNAKNKCYNVNCIENVGKRCTQEKKCVFYIAATEELSVSEENEIEMDIKNAEIYLRNSEIEKHHKIIKSQPEYFEGIRSIPINQIDVPACFKKNRPAEKKIDALLEYYEEHGCLDKPVTVVFRNNKYVLKDKFLRYYVGKMLKLKKIDAICTVD